MKVHPANPNLVWVEKFGCGMWQDITHHKMVVLGKGQKLTVLRQQENIAGLGVKVVAYKPPAPPKKRAKKAELRRRVPYKYQRTPEIQAAFEVLSKLKAKRRHLELHEIRTGKEVVKAERELNLVLKDYWKNKHEKQSS